MSKKSKKPMEQLAEFIRADDFLKILEIRLKEEDGLIHNICCSCNKNYTAKNLEDSYYCPHCGYDNSGYSLHDLLNPLENL